MKKIQIGLMVLLLGIGASTALNAHDSIGFSLNIGQPYYEPPPVYYAPPPVVYYPARPVYREYYSANPNTYYYPRAERYYDNDGWREHHEYHEHHGHHEHEHDDDD